MVRRAFTLIELLVVIAVILILTSGTGFSYLNSKRNQRDAQRINDVILISKAIDQSVAANRGAFPINAYDHVTPSKQQIMCASEILNPSGTNWNGIDQSLFPDHDIPQDPLVSGTAKTTGCTDMSNGYVYHTHYGNNPSSFAVKQNVTYSLEVGLERPVSSEQSSFRSPTQLPALKAAGVADSVNGRYRFVFNGSYCASACYQ